ncbi:MAG: hypothetical protein K0V04_18415 [Deltaproteobacteria bacterium]|nr:hypothetical protein [Deltaproteobacteria bacterium]
MSDAAIGWRRGGLFTVGVDAAQRDVDSYGRSFDDDDHHHGCVVDVGSGEALSREHPYRLRAVMRTNSGIP